MPSAFPALSIFLFVTALLCLGLGIYALSQSATVFGRHFGGLMFCGALYALGYGLELAAPDLATMQATQRVQYLGIPFVPYFWVGLAWSYLEPRGMPPRWHLGLLGLSTLVLLAFQSNDLHRQYYTQLAYTHEAGLAIAVIGKGLCYWFNIAYLNLSTVMGVLLLFRAWRQSVSLYRQQAGLLLLGSLLPWLFHLLYQLGLSPHGIDLSPFGLAATGLVFAVACLRHSVLDVLPMARDLVFDGVAEGVIVLDLRQRIIDFNRAARRFFPQLDHSLIGTEGLRMPDVPALAQAMRQAEPCIHEGGGRRVEVRHQLLHDRRGLLVGSALLVQDVTEKLALLDELRALATLDGLTGCYNRRHLLELAARELLRARRHQRALSVLIVDVDDFKFINDSQGHAAGDTLLSRLTTTLRQRLRATDIFGRYGGDEFVIVLPETGADCALLIAEDLCRLAREQCAHGLSIGVATLGVEHEDFAALLREADRALYRSKAAGKGRAAVLSD